jgi:hypothetical protein
MSLANRVNVSTYAYGVGEKRARGKGSVGMERVTIGNDALIELSVGRSSTSKWNPHSLSSAWVRLTPSQVHELASAMLYLVGCPSACSGEGLQTIKHKTNFKFLLEFEADFCTLLQQGPELKEEVIKAVREKLDAIKVPELQEKKNADV